MGYNLINWENSPSKQTPINAENLNQMDENIAKAIQGTRFNFSATFTSDGVLKNTTSTEALSTGSFATSQTDIVTVFVADNVTKINSGTFSGCTSLKTIYIDNVSSGINIATGAVPSGVNIIYSTDDNFINVNELLASAIKSLKTNTADEITKLKNQATTDKTEWQNRADEIEQQATSDIESLKSGKLDKTDFNTYKTKTDKSIQDSADSIKANTTAINKGIADIANNSALINQNAIKVTTDKSTSTVLNDSSDCNIVNLTAYGSSIQSEVPMPTAPVDITDISGVNLYAYGKNLFDFDNTAFSKFRISNLTVDKENKSVSFVSNNDDLSGFFIKNMFINKNLKGNITTSLVVTTDSECQVHFMASSLEQGLKTIKAGSTKMQVQGTLEKGSDFWFYVKGQNHSITVSNIQIELGDTATEYEDFNNVQTIKISDVVLRSVGDICDKIIINRNGDGYIERNIGVINLKNIPKEQWMKSGQKVDRYYAPLTISYNIQDYSKLLCTHFKKESNNDGEAIGKITSNSTNIGFAFAEKDTTTMEDWVSFNNNNDVLLYYILSTPTVTQLTQEQVNNVLNIKTNYPNTTIIADSNVQLSYVADTKHYIDNKFNEIATALVAHESEVM